LSPFAARTTSSRSCWYVIVARVADRLALVVVGDAIAEPAATCRSRQL
jgi:hypothetical protein